ncbi:hypothetical protein HPP92_020690 [Vanilla planifolia]|uniref:Scarecrow-like protein 8 n=1 Tax=Vanilla planifolia TaxID=51239 RepID=A0A835PYI8_VANPL|nr:hypothetical protein HPP92_020690 [Vanilla planifolia]
MEKKSTMANRLLELERQLLEDDDEEEQISISGSVVTNCEWRDAIQKLISSPSTATATNQHSMSSSPTNSSSSSSGSSFSITQSTPSPSRQMLLDTATAISEGDHYTAASNLAILKRAANQRGDPDQRLTAIMIEALVSRLNPRDPMITLPITDICSSEHHSALHMLYESSPCFKLGFIAANFAILESTKDHTKIHILDFDVGQGGQLASFINAVSERQSLRSPRSPPISVKITAVSDISLPFFPHTAAGERHLCTVGDRLATLAKHLGVGFRFNIVKRKIHELDRETLGCEAGEALAVNLAFLISRVADESVSPANPRDELLRQVKSLKPTVVTLVEQEINGNTAPFATRFAEACSHYGALLESLDATSNRESTGRAGIEACLARKAANSIAHEGPDRVERCEVYGKWRARMGMAGFQTLPVGPTVIEPLKLRLASLRNNPGFTLKEEAGRLGCGWMGRVLTVASAWR